MRIVNPKTHVEYVLQADRASEDKTVFVLRRLTREEMFEYAGKSPFSVEQAARIAAAQKSGDPKRIAKEEAALAPKTFEDVSRHMVGYVYVLRRGLVEIRNLRDENGHALKMTPEVFVDYAPADVLRELGEEILTLSTLSAGERKN